MNRFYQDSIREVDNLNAKLENKRQHNLQMKNEKDKTVCSTSRNNLISIRKVSGETVLIVSPDDVMTLHNEHAALVACEKRLAAIMDELSDGKGISQQSGQMAFKALNDLTDIRNQ
jgi:hypothetical protein